MAQRSRRTSKAKPLPKPAQIVAFTEIEEAFFREGEAAERAAQGEESFDHESVDTFEDLESPTEEEASL